MTQQRNSNSYLFTTKQNRPWAGRIHRDVLFLDSNAVRHGNYQLIGFCPPTARSGCTSFFFFFPVKPLCVGIHLNPVQWRPPPSVTINTVVWCTTRQSTAAVPRLSLGGRKLKFNGQPPAESKHQMIWTVLLRLKMLLGSQLICFQRKVSLSQIIKMN